MALKTQIESMRDKIRQLIPADRDGLAQKRRRRRLALYSVLAVLVYIVFGGDQGLISLAQSWRETYALRREISELQRENHELEGKKLALAHDRAYYEKIAREKLLLKNPGDLIYRFDRN